MAYDRRAPYLPCSACGELTRSSAGVCKRPSCSAAYYKSWRETDLESYRGKVREGNRVRAATWRAANPDKEHEKGKRWRDNNPEKAAAKVEHWRLANPEKVNIQSAAGRSKRRSLKLNVPTSRVKPVALLLLLQRGICSLCDLSLGTDITIDHIVPLSRGGWDVPGNLALAHKSCNSGKCNRVDLNSSVCREAFRRSQLFIERVPELVTFPAGW